MFALVEYFQVGLLPNGRPIVDFFVHTIWPDLDQCTMGRAAILAAYQVAGKALDLACVPMGSTPL